MAAKTVPSIGRLHEALIYYPETGKFVWKSRPADHFQGNLRVTNSWNSRLAKKEAGHVGGVGGYVLVSVFGKLVYGHRLAWALHTGEWPSHCIDHINGNRADNRIQNLRRATPSQNSLHRVRPTRNASGFRGVSFVKGGVRHWQAAFRVGETRHYLGVFHTPEEAARAATRARSQVCGEFCGLVP